MATEQTGRIPSLEELTIVDADSHVSVDVEELVGYMDERSVGRRMIDNASHVPSEVLTKTRVSPAFPNTSSDYHGNMAGYDSRTPEGKLGFMDEFGVEYSVLTPTGDTATINHDQTAVAYINAYNSWLLDTWLDVDDRLFATAAVADQVPEKGAEEIDRMAGEDDVVGVQMPAAGLVPPAGHRRYEPIYEAAEDRGLPIVMHSLDSTSAVSFPIQHQWAETFAENHAFTFPVEAMWHLNSLVCNGVPERFPDLEFVIQEPGFEWVSWMMWRLDDHYYQYTEDLPGLTKPPSEYIRDQFYFTTQPLGHTENYQHMGWAMEMAGGAETILFSTDHPHPDFDPPREVYRPARTQLDEEGIRGVMGETAIDVFGLE